MPTEAALCRAASLSKFRSLSEVSISGSATQRLHIARKTLRAGVQELWASQLWYERRDRLCLADQCRRAAWNRLKGSNLPSRLETGNRASQFVKIHQICPANFGTSRFLSSCRAVETKFGMIQARKAIKDIPELTAKPLESEIDPLHRLFRFL